MNDAWKKNRFGAIERGENPMVLARMKSGYAVIGDTQFLPGYCVLLAYPKVNALEDLLVADRNQYLADRALLGQAVTEVCHPWRMNYAIYGNSDEFLHAHVFPRYRWESDERRQRPVQRYPIEMWRMPALPYTDALHETRQTVMTQRLAELMAKSCC
jgi:diadenosine tetraphosphate (Ap4A) HIT family hydrolase